MMTVISVPARLRLSASALFLCIPFIILEVILANRASWWNVPYRSVGYWSFIFALICVPLFIWLTSAKKWALTLSALLAGVWIVLSGWVSIRMRYPALGFYTLFLLMFFVGELLWLKYELTRSFIDPQLSWYQSLPKPIPGLSCELSTGEQKVSLRVSRIDEEGVFVFSSGEWEDWTGFSSFLDRKKLDLVFAFRDRQMICQGIPTVALLSRVGAGIRFVNSSADLNKEIGDFVEVLRGEGYA